MKTIRNILIGFCCWTGGAAMSQPLTITQAVERALQNNPTMREAGLSLELAKQQKRSTTEIGKFSAFWITGEFNSVNRDNNFTFTQTIPFPTSLARQASAAQAGVVKAEKGKEVAANELTWRVRAAYYHLAYLQASRQTLLKQDSLLGGFVRAATLRYQSGESTLLEKLTAESQSQEIKNQLQQHEADVRIAANELQLLLRESSPIEIADEFQPRALPAGLDTTDLKQNPQLDFLQQQVIVQNRIRQAEANKMLPDITVGYFNQSLIGYQTINGQDQFFDASRRFQGFQLGLAFPLWLAPSIAKVKSASIEKQIAETQRNYYQQTLKSEFLQTLQSLDKNNLSLQYYQNTALPNADLILSQAGKAYRGGEIGYLEYLQSIRNATEIYLNHLSALHKYNQTIIRLEYLLGQ